MKRQVRPFVVEVKQKRGSQKRGGSIWGDVDLSSIVAGTKALEQADSQLIDSSVASVVSGHEQKPRAEQKMANPKEPGTVQLAAEEPAIAAAPEIKKAARPKVGKSPRKRSAPTAEIPAVQSQPSSGRTGRKIYSTSERAQKLDQIEKSIGRGDSVKSATKQAGISEQTYYQWKKTATPAIKSDDLKDLLALEEENKRLKSLLADRLRKENAELKKKLGLQ